MPLSNRKSVRVTRTAISRTTDAFCNVTIGDKTQRFVMLAASDQAPRATISEKPDVVAFPNRATSWICESVGTANDAVADIVRSVMEGVFEEKSFCSGFRGQSFSLLRDGKKESNIPCGLPTAARGRQFHRWRIQRLYARVALQRRESPAGSV